MLYKFKSRATGDLIMLEPNGRRVLQIIGKPLEPPKGILQPQEMPAAIAALEAAVAKEEADRKAALEQARQKGKDAPASEAVSLRQRVLPFIDMLRRCHAADREIVWGV